MKEINYFGTTLEKDLDFCRILHELKQRDDVLIVSCGDPVIVHECDSFSLAPTGRKHVGYLSHFVTLYHEGLLFSIYPSNYYPLAGERPGKWNFIPYVRVGGTEKHQVGYYHKYESFEDIERFAKTHRQPRRLKDTYPLPIDAKIGIYVPEVVRCIVQAAQGVNEKNILNTKPFFLKSDIWNSRMRIVNVVSNSGNFRVDLVSGKLCG